MILEATESDDEANGEVTESLLEEKSHEPVLQEEDSDLVFINCSGMQYIVQSFTEFYLKINLRSSSKLSDITFSK